MYLHLKCNVILVDTSNS